MIYLDTGCLVKLYYPEPDSAVVAGLVHGKPMWHTPLHELEFTNALGLKAFRSSASIAQIQSARNLVTADLNAGVLVSSEVDWRDIFAEATRLAETAHAVDWVPVSRHSALRRGEDAGLAGIPHN